MKRRDFVKGAGGAALGASALSFLKVLPAEAAGKDGTAVVVIGDTINSLDIHRSGTSRPTACRSPLNSNPTPNSRTGPR